MKKMNCVPDRNTDKTVRRRIATTRRIIQHIPPGVLSRIIPFPVTLCSFVVKKYRPFRPAGYINSN